jgi:hypothetical protein
MKFALATLAATVAVASAKKVPVASKDITPGAIKADSKLGMRVLSKARKLDENQNEEIEFTWVADYSIKFQGCHHISQWNDEADGEDEPFIQTKRLVRFRLCPTDSCSYENAGGCDSSYGDYIIDMNTFLAAYWEDKLNNCEVYQETVCNCENANNEEYCQYDCLVDNGMDYCVEENPYQANDENQQDDGYEEPQIEQMLECAQFDFDEDAYYNYQYNNNNNANNRRKLEEEVQYFMGPYCSDQGGKIFMGVFTDEFCTNFVEDHDDFYYKMTGGHKLPYSSESLVDMECVSTKEYQEQDNDNNNNGNNDNDNADADEVKEAWEEVYANAGKCETQLNNQYVSPNENACNYIEGIKIVRKDGIVVQGSSAKSKTAAVFIGIFSVSFILLGAYVYYLKTKLDRAKINLSE